MYLLLESVTVIEDNDVDEDDIALNPLVFSRTLKCVFFVNIYLH